jgi:MHS family proline/betaine transporter-like MFS transporter
LVAGIIGNVMEWYDFALYGYFAPVIAKLFFPSEDHLASLIATFGVFAAGFVMRPIGALLFGHLGDTVGRTKALAASVILMAVPTFLCGLLPTYDTIGETAPLLLTLLRLMQGLSVGGEFTGSIAFMVEHAPSNHRGIVGSWTVCGAALGTLLGSAIGALATWDLPASDLYSWGWRIPFLIGLGVGVLGLYLRKGIGEPEEFRILQESGKVARSPIRDVLTHRRTELLTAIGLSWLNGVAFYTLFVYMTTYVVSILKMPLGVALMINTVSMGVMAVLAPAMAALSDRIGRIPTLLSGALGLALLSYPLFKLIGHDTIGFILAGQLVFAVLLSVYVGPMPAALVELFPARERYTGLSIGYNLSMAIFGGTAPLMATFLIRETGNVMAPSFYVIITAVSTVALLFRHPETFRITLR